MKALVLASFLLLLGTLSHTQDWSLQIKQFPHIVYRMNIQAGDDKAFCSAVVVNDDTVLTAGHCAPLPKKETSLTVDEKHAEVLKRNDALDLAVLHVEGLGGRPVQLRKDDLTPGTPISVIGYGFAAQHLKYGFGWVADARDNSLRTVGDRLYFSAAGVVPGDSGGAVVDYSGRLCTIVQGVLFAGPSSIAYGSPTSVIEDFVKKFLKP